MTFDVLAAVEAALEGKSKEERDREARLQAERRAQLGAPSDIEVKIQYGRREEALALEAVRQEQEGAWDRLAEAYALQGDYDMAYFVAQDPHRQREYQIILEALNGTTPCDCPASIKSHNQFVATRFLKAQIFARDKIVDLYACAVCRKVTC